MSAMLKVVEKEGMENKNKALDAALSYSNWVFAGAVLVWLFNWL